MFAKQNADGKIVAISHEAPEALAEEKSAWIEVTPDAEEVRHFGAGLVGLGQLIFCVIDQLLLVIKLFCIPGGGIGQALGRQASQPLAGDLLAPLPVVVGVLIVSEQLRAVTVAVNR